MAKLTELEIKVIKAFDTNYSDAESEKADNATSGHVKGIAKATGLDAATVKGVFGSLTKKGMIVDSQDDSIFYLTDDGIDAHYA